MIASGDVRGDGGRHGKAMQDRSRKLDVDADVALRAVLRGLLGRNESFVVGRYELRRRLGEGAFGSVYLARDPRLHRDVAVKLIRPKKSRHLERMRSRLQREAQALARLRHPNVI